MLLYTSQEIVCYSDIQNTADWIGEYVDVVIMLAHTFVRSLHFGQRLASGRDDKKEVRSGLMNKKSPTPFQANGGVFVTPV